jgi:hypothetical protein
MPDVPVTYNVTRFACHCGRFLAESAIRHTDHRDDSRYYGIRSEVEWDCGRCGTVKGEEWEPHIVVTATRPIPPGSRCTCGAGDHRPPGAHNIHCADPDASATRPIPPAVPGDPS